MLWTDVIDPAELTGYARGALADLPANSSKLRAFLPNRLVSDIEWTAYRGSGGLDQAAQYRAYDATSRVAERPRAEKVSGELPPISEELRLGEWEILKKRADPEQPIRDALIGDAVVLAKRIETRQEVARGQALATGTIVINENRVITTVDFGRRGDFTTTVSTPWVSTGSSDPINDLVALADLYEEENGERPGATLMSRQAIRLMMKSAAFRALFSINGATPTIITQAQVGAMLEDNELPPIFPYEKRYANSAGQATRVIPWTTAIMLPAPVAEDAWQDTQLGATFYGETAESTEYAENYDIQPGEEPGIIAAVHKEDRPVAVWTNAAAISMPVLANPNLSLAVTVSTP